MGKALSGELSCGSRFFPLRVDPIEKGCKNEYDRVAIPESIAIHLKSATNQCEQHAYNILVTSTSVSR